MNEIIDLDGVTIARVLANQQEGTALLILMASSGFTEAGHYFPAESIRVDNLEGLTSLRDALNKAIESLAKVQNPPLPKVVVQPVAYPPLPGGIKL